VAYFWNIKNKISFIVDSASLCESPNPRKQISIGELVLISEVPGYSSGY